MAFRDISFEDNRRSRSSTATEDWPRARAPVTTSGVLAVFWRRKFLVAAVIGASLVIGLLYIVMTPPRYLASTAMLIDPRLGKSIGTDPVQPGFVVDTGAVDSQLKLFTSQTVLARVAKMADLANDPEFNGSQRSFLQRLLHPATGLDGGVDLRALEKAITIKRPERTYVVGIDVLAQDAKRAAEIANDLTQAYIEDQVAARVDAAQDDTRFVRQQMAKLSTQIKEAEDKVEAFKTKNQVVDANGLRSNEQQVADLTKALGEARARTSDAKSRFDEIEQMQRSGQLDASSQAVKSLTIERLRQQQAETEQSVAKLAQTLGPRHPELLEARGRQAKIDKLIRDELHRLAASAAADYRSAQSNEKQMLADVDRLKRQSNDISRDLVPLDQLEHNVRTLRASYDRFSQIRDNLAQQEADSPPGRVIAVARAPVSPAQPKRSLVGIIALSAGIFFGLAAALFAESLAPASSTPRAPEPTPFFDEPDQPPPPRRQPRPNVRRYWDDDDV